MATFTIKVFIIYIKFFLSSVVFFPRTNCPKVTPPSILLSDEERKIWEQSEAIQDKNRELIEAILSRYGFTEVNFLRSNELNISDFKGISNIQYNSSTIWYSNISRSTCCTSV
jgi:hypothetical protein